MEGGKNVCGNAWFFTSSDVALGVPLFPLTPVSPKGLLTVHDLCPKG